MTFQEFKAVIRDTLFPDGEPENQALSHDRMIVDALVELQRVVSCLKENHQTIVPHCSTFFERGLTVFETPEGYQNIRRLYTLTDDCCPIYYQFRKSAQNQMEDWVKDYVEAYELPERNIYLPPGVVQASPEFDREPGVDWNWNALGRSAEGYFTIRNGRIYVAPWINSNERIILEWDGIKTVWADDAEITSDPALRRAVELWVKKEHVRLYDPDKTDYQVTVNEWQEARANLIMDC